MNELMPDRNRGLGSFPETETNDAQRKLVHCRLAAQQPFGQRRALVGRHGFGADQGDAAVEPASPQLRYAGGPGLPGPDHDHIPEGGRAAGHRWAGEAAATLGSGAGAMQLQGPSERLKIQ